MGGNNKFIDKFSNVAMRVGGQIHLKALRDTFVTIIALASLIVMMPNVLEVTPVGFMNPCVVYIPWTTPPLVNA